MRALLLDKYTLGLADVLKAKDGFPEADHIVTGGSWNGYTPQAKQYGRENGIGIFVIEEFLGALNLPNPQDYVKKKPDGSPDDSFIKAE